MPTESVQFRLNCTVPVIVACLGNLKDFSSCVYVKRDKTVTARPNATFERLKYPAEKEQKEVVVMNDQLLIYGRVFTLQSGFADSYNAAVRDD
jgi:hypothetical protein